jgi:hypothetical protein
MSALELAGLALVGAAVWFWIDTLGAREVCLDAARGACRREGLQLLDETVAVEHLRFRRSDAGWLRIERDYVFEYSSTGADRHKGRIRLAGRNMTLLDLGQRPQLHLVH